MRTHSCRIDRSRRRIYELLPESESNPREAQVNLAEAAEDPSQSSEEPKANFAQEVKPRCTS
jgi:hypothetical protein